MHFKITFIIAELFNATSTVNSNFCTSTSLPTRRTSIRQAEKRARKNLPPVLSPIRSPSPPKVPRRGVPISEKTPGRILFLKNQAVETSPISTLILVKGGRNQRGCIFLQTLSENLLSCQKETPTRGKKQEEFWQECRGRDTIRLHLIGPEQTGGPDRWDV